MKNPQQIQFIFCAIHFVFRVWKVLSNVTEVQIKIFGALLFFFKNI